MEVHLDWDEPPMGRDKPKQKRGRPQGRRASSPAEVADQTGRVLAEREPEWLERLTTDPASFAAVEREVHEQARRQADLYVAGLLAKAGESPEMTQHVDRVRANAVKHFFCMKIGGFGDSVHRSCERGYRCKRSDIRRPWKNRQFREGLVHPRLQNT